MRGLFDKLKLLKGLRHGRWAFVGPIFVGVELTNRCNLKCPGCKYHSPLFVSNRDSSRKFEDFSVELFRKLCDGVKAVGTKEVIFTGQGEPFLHPDIWRMIEIAKEQNLCVTSFTNGTLLNGDTVDALIRSRLDILRVSFWTASAEEYEKRNSGSDEGNFSKITNGLSALAELKAKKGSRSPLVVCHFVIDRENLHEIHSVLPLAQSVGCHAVSFSILKTWGDSLDPFVPEADEIEVLKHSLRGMKKACKKAGLQHNLDEVLFRYEVGRNVWDRSPCYVGWFHVRVHIDGSVFPCDACDIPLGSLQEKSLEEIWNSDRMQAFRADTATCKGLRGIGCDCAFCCHVHRNYRVDRVFKWVAP